MSYVPQGPIRILESSLSLPQIRYDLVPQASYARNKAADVQYHDPSTSHIFALSSWKTDITICACIFGPTHVQPDGSVGPGLPGLHRPKVSEGPLPISASDR
jgi:hypothetical protein